MAADAALNSARYGWWQVLVGIAGVLVSGATLAAAIAAARYAKRAAAATESTIDIARQGTDAAAKAAAVATSVELPIVVLVDADHDRTMPDPGGAPALPIRFTVTFATYGRTPAILERLRVAHHSGKDWSQGDPLAAAALTLSAHSRA